MKEATSVKNLEKEKAILVVVDYPSFNQGWTAESIRHEMSELVVACGGDVLDSMVCKIHKPSASTLISAGVLKELVNLCAIRDVDTVIFSHDLKGSQQRNIEDALKVKTIDRTQLILDIFAKNAISQEGKMQVELAQLEYLRPRLVGHGIELSRLGGGIGSLGPGETKLEVDRRRIDQRIAHLRRNLKEISFDRGLKRKKRKVQGVPTLSLVGYTNAGKSTLLNALTSAGQTTRDGLFTTLDSLSRQYVLPNHQRVILSDTVGFMRQLPHQLIEAFKATLEEVREADILLHVLDVSNPDFRRLHDAVNDVLRELNVLDKPIVMILNKIDVLSDDAMVKSIAENFSLAVSISAKSKTNFEALNQLIEALVADLFIEIDVMVPIKRMDLVNLAHKDGEVYSIKYYNDKINIRASVPSVLAGKFQKASLSAEDEPGVE